MLAVLGAVLGGLRLRVEPPVFGKLLHGACAARVWGRVADGGVGVSVVVDIAQSRR